MRLSVKSNGRGWRVHVRRNQVRHPDRTIMEVDFLDPRRTIVQVAEVHDSPGDLHPYPVRSLVPDHRDVAG